MTRLNLIDTEYISKLKRARKRRKKALAVSARELSVSKNILKRLEEDDLPYVLIAALKIVRHYNFTIEECFGHLIPYASKPEVLDDELTR